MTLKRTMFLMSMLGTATALFSVLGQKVNSGFLFLMIPCIIIGSGLFFYMVYREKTGK